jgi:hypothetical protein
VSVAGGYGLWADRLELAHNAVTSACRNLSDERCGLFSEGYRRGGWDTWRGAMADHFLQLITRLDRQQLQSFVEHLSRFRAALDRLHSEVRLAAQAQKANLPLPQGLDIDAALRPWREWPPTSVDLILGPGWNRPPRSTEVVMDITAVRSLARSLLDVAHEVEKIRLRLGDGLDHIGIPPPPFLDCLGRATEDLAEEIRRRADAMERADREVAAAAGGVRWLTWRGPRWTGPRARTRNEWRDAALRRAGIDGAAWDPRKGLHANDRTVVRVWERYGEFQHGHPELQWAGMANLVGPTFYAGWQDLYSLRKAGDSDRAKLISRLVPGMGGRLAREAARVLTVEELRWFEERFLIMQKKIFEDLAWQHEAYLAGGIAEMRRLKAAGEIRAAVLEAWEDIASGDPKRVANGNRALLRREQKDVIGKDYTTMRKHHPPVGEVFTSLMTEAAESPIPGGRPYRDVVQHVDGPNLPNLPDLPGFLPNLPDLPDLPAIARGNVAKFNDRWEWIDKDMLPAYQRIGRDPEQLQDLIDTPIAERAEKLRLIPLEYRA